MYILLSQTGNACQNVMPHCLTALCPYMELHAFHVVFSCGLFFLNEYFQHVLEKKTRKYMYICICMYVHMYIHTHTYNVHVDW